MKLHYLFFLLFLFVFFQSRAQKTREIVNFNKNWKFHNGDIAEGQSISSNDQEWRVVDLPHDWSVEGPRTKELASCTGFLPGGIGWYRKSFTLASDLRNKQVFICFDGVYKNSEVWINGHLLGKRPNGFVAFYYDLTPYLNNEKSNLIAVRVDHSDYADSRWYTGSGINRDVSLIAVDPVHIPVWGVTFSTPEVSKSLAKTEVKVSVHNKTAANENVVVKCELTDKSNKKFSAQKTLTVQSDKGQEIVLNLDVANPILWSVESPNLYHLKVSLLVNGKKTDEITEVVGIRSIRFDPDRGFFLNEKNLKLKGVCIHDDAGVLGTAVPSPVWERRLVALKKAGCNSIRMSHNPHASFLYDLCDKLGFLVMDEAFDEWEEGKNKWIEGWNVGTPGKDGYHTYFKEWSDRDLRDMILRDRNHPSVLMWSIGNEIDYPNDPYSHEILNTGRNPQIYGKGYQPNNPPASRLGELSKHLVQVAKQYDTTRPVTAALAGVVMSNLVGYPQNLDIVGYNYQEYRYPEDHQAYPERVIYGSENGMSLDAWNAVDTNMYISAQYLWTGVDYLGEAGRWPSRGSRAGLLDLAGFPKPGYYFRQSLWSDEPMVYLATSGIPSGQGRRNMPEPVWNRNAGEKVRVYCYTNGDEAELFLNNQSLGRKELSKDRIITWDIGYEPGELLVRSFKKGKETAEYSLRTAGKAAEMKIVADPKTTRNGLIQAEIQVTDSVKTLVYTDNHDIQVKVQGGKLLGIENADPNSLENGNSGHMTAYHGRLIVYVEAFESGTVQITAESAGLKTGKAVIKVH